MSATTIRIWCYNSFRVHGNLMSVVLVHNKSFSQPVFKLNISYPHIKVWYSQHTQDSSVVSRRTIGWAKNKKHCFALELLYGSLEVEESSWCFIYVDSSDKSVGSLKHQDKGFLRTAGVRNLWPVCHHWRAKGDCEIHIKFLWFCCINVYKNVKIKEILHCTFW